MNYDAGFNPSVSIDQNTFFTTPTAVVEIHQAGQDLSDLWYHVGELASYATDKPSITWGSAYKLTNKSGASVAGYAPTISVDSGYAMAVYQGGGGTLWYSFGAVSGSVIDWGDPVNYDSGYNPSVSLLGGGIVEAHQGGHETPSPLYMRIGNYSSSGVTWIGVAQYATSGCYPSVAQLFGYWGNPYIEGVHSTACGTSGLLFSFGELHY